VESGHGADLHPPELFLCVYYPHNCSARCSKCSPLALSVHLFRIDTFTVITFMNTAAAFQIVLGHMFLSLLICYEVAKDGCV
jgi:hypothetical protein